MALTLESAARLLDRHGLLREIIRGDVWTLDPHDIKGFDEPFSAITYDTRKVEPGTFLCCKGRFKAEYLQGIDERGLAAYVSENDFSDATQAPGLIVDDVRKAMALLKSLKVQEKSFQAFLCLLECSRVGKRTKVCKLEPPGTLIKSAYLSPMVPRGCSPLDRYSCSSGKLGNASSSFSCPSILIPPSD